MELGRMTKVWVSLLVLGSALSVGCMERTGFLPNEDVALRKKDDEFVADAAKRFPYKESAPRGQITARAEVDYMYRYVGVANLSEESWKDAEVWVNQKYVVSIPAWQSSTLKRIQFTMLRDERGNAYTTDQGHNPVKKVEIFADGKMYDVPVVLAD